MLLRIVCFYKICLLVVNMLHNWVSLFYEKGNVEMHVLMHT